MLIAHACWSDGRLLLWAENSDDLLSMGPLRRGGVSSAAEDPVLFAALADTSDANDLEATDQFGDTATAVAVIEADDASTEAETQASGRSLNGSSYGTGHAPESDSDHVDDGSGIRGAEVRPSAPESNGQPIHPHPFAAAIETLTERLRAVGIRMDRFRPEPAGITLALPAVGRHPLPSPPLVRQTGIMDDIAAADAAIGRFDVPALAIPAQHVMPCLALLGDLGSTHTLSRGDSLIWFVTISRFIGEFLTAQRVVPMLAHESDGGYSGHWRLWLEDEEARRRLGMLLECMPPVARAICDDCDHNGWIILEDVLNVLADRTVRRYLIENELNDALSRFDPKSDHHVAWLAGLLDDERVIALDGEQGLALFRGAREWLGRLTDVGEDEPFHLCFKLDEPATTSKLPEFGEVDAAATWPLTFYLQSSLDPDLIIPAERVWSAGGEVLAAQGARIERPQDRLLSELARAAKIYDRLEPVLNEPRPVATALTTPEATRFLRDVKPVLEESGFTTLVPAWWDQPETRLSARLHVDSEDVDFEGDTIAAVEQSAAGPVGLDSLVKYSWQIAIGDQTLTEEEFRQLAKMKSSLVRIHGRWVEVRPDDLSTATNFLSENSGGEISVRDALR
ncbi:MAG: SNF2 helicase-associated domain-containing protein, partial [Planctomycetota bacterium]